MTGMRAGLGRLRERVRGRFRPTPVLIGHSHTKAIFEAAEASATRLDGYNFWNAPQPAVSQGRDALHPEIALSLRRGPVFSAVGGAVHNVLAMVRHPRPFDFILPSHPQLPVAKGTELLPFAAIRQAMAAALEEYLQIMRLVRSHAQGRMFHLEPPPPLEDGARVLDDVPWMYFPDLTREVAPASLRYKCWRLHSELVQEFCGAHDIEMLPAPLEAIDEGGYLKPVHYLDAMHVKASYGALVLDQMRRAL